jgi:hypothetical protein
VTGIAFIALGMKRLHVVYQHRTLTTEKTKRNLEMQRTEGTYDVVEKKTPPVHMEVSTTASGFNRVGRTSESAALCGFASGFIFCVVIVVAGKIHWGNEAPLCLVPAEVPFQDYTTPAVNYTNYPNPRCASLYRDGGRFPEDKGAMHYFWQLPPETRNLPASQTMAWLFYCFHQLSVWATIFFAQREYNEHDGPKYSQNIRSINAIALLVNFICWLLHLLHTHIWYDALAPSVHEMSSQGSVILMLVIILLMEGPKRGLFFGKPAMAWNFEVIEICKRYHGYVFSWAVIYTFWYHPMEGYLGHLFGFFHVWLVMLQGSLMYTTLHLNRYWRTLCEAWVFVHGMVISMQTLSSESWPMFTFGFGAIFVLTQVPGLPCLQAKHLVFRLIPLLVFLVVYVIVFVMVTKWTKWFVVFFIPLAEYLGAIGLNGFMYMVFRAMRFFSPKQNLRLGASLFVSCIMLTIACSIYAQTVELAGGSGGAIIVYIPMCILVPLSMFALNMALSFKKSGHELDPSRLPQEGRTTCCGTY